MTLDDSLAFNLHQGHRAGCRHYAPSGSARRTTHFPATTVPALISYAKANPGKITMASAGVGSAAHIFWELFKAMAGVDLQHVPYRGEGPGLAPQNLSW